MTIQTQKPSAAFVGASWLSLVIGMATFMIGIWNANLSLSEKGFFGIAFVLSLFASVAVQKNVRDARIADGSAEAYSKRSE